MSGPAEEYHRQTGYSRYGLGGGGLDFGNQPDVFKTYSGLESVALPSPSQWPQDLLSTVIRGRQKLEGRQKLDLPKLAAIIMLTHSVTAKARYSGTDFYFRSPASAGALYPFELYVALSGVAGLEDGLYHHGVQRQILTRLRLGNPAQEVADAVPTPKDTQLNAAFFLTSIFFRSSWKYRDRAYRYHLLDTGHLAENLFLALKWACVPFDINYDFDDRRVNKLLGVDDNLEGCLVIVRVGGIEAPEGKPTTFPAAAPNLSEASRTAVRERRYPVINRIHESTLPPVREVAEPVKMHEQLGVTAGTATPAAWPQTWPEEMNYSEAVANRRSKRNFVQDHLPADVFNALLESLFLGIHNESSEDRIIKDSIAVGLLVGNVEGIAPGFYLLHPEARSPALVSGGRMTNNMAAVCLGQEWLRHAAVHFLFLTNLELMEKTWGPRSYRHAMLTAGRLGQRIYLAGTAMGAGCCGIGAFYDGEAADLLGLGPQSALLYMVAVGPLKKRSLQRRQP